MDALPPLLVGLPLAAAALTVLARSRLALRRALGMSAAIGALGIALALVGSTADGASAGMQVGGWPPGIAIPLVADLLAAMMCAVGALMLVACLAFAALRDEDRHPLYHSLVQVLAAGAFAAFLTADLFNLFVSFEVMLAASYVLLTLHGDRSQVRAGAVYITTNLLGSTILLAGVGLTYGVAGTVHLGALYGAGAQTGVAIAVGVVGVALAVKAAMVPVHAWLPRSYPAAPPAVAALFSGLLTKAGIYVLYRLWSVVFAGAPPRPGVLLAFASVTMIVGVLGAVGGAGVREILSFHMVSQIGYLLVPLGLATAAGFAVGIFYLVQYIIVKGALFLVAGVIETAHGTGALKRLGGAARRSPLLAVAFLGAAAALAGLPPLSGFVAKVLLIRAAFDAGAYVVGAVAVAVSLLTLTSMVKVWNGAFWGAAPVPEARPAVAAPRERAVIAGGAEDWPPPIHVRLALPALVLAALTVAAGLWPQGLAVLAEHAAAGLADPSAYLEVVGQP